MEDGLQEILIEWVRNDEWDLFTLSEWIRDHHEYSHAEIEQCINSLLKDDVLHMDYNGTITLVDDHNN